jgi:hypothetical protein
MLRLLATRGWRLAACLVLLVAVAQGCGAEADSAGSGGRVPHAAGLRWAPPKLDDPIAIEAPRGGFTEFQLDPGRDYVVELPAAAKVGGLTLVGGHDVAIVGGEITVPAVPGGTEVDDRLRRALYLKDATGTVHVEGVLLDAAPGATWDGIDIATPEATVQIENVRVTGVKGSAAGFHGDVVQPWGGVKALRIDRLSATSDYQGLTIPVDQGPIGAARISRVDLHRIPRDPGRGRLLWLTSGSSTCDSYPVRLKRVFVEPRPSRRTGLGNAVWPGTGRPPQCGARTTGGVATWPALPTVVGEVRAGVPPHGPYVPPGLAGVGYVSHLGEASGSRRAGG